MNFRYLSIVILIFIVGFSDSSMAQKTMSFSDPARAYKQALEIYDQQKFNIAFHRFSKFINEYETLDDSRSNLLVADAYYYKAASAAAQKDPKTEDYYLEYLSEFKGHSFANIAYYDLGNWYFEKRNYRDALAYYDKVNENALDKRIYEAFVFKKGFCYFSIKDFNRAQLAWQTIINKPASEFYEEANYYNGMAAYYEENYETAITAFQKVEKVSRYKNALPYYITQIKFLEEDYEGVIDYAVPIVDKPSIRNKGDMYQLIGQSYFEIENFEKAVEYLEDFEALAKNLTKEDYYQLGYAQYKTGKYADAVL